MKPRTSPRLAGSQASRSETRGIRACQIRPQERQLISTFVEKSKITSWEINEFLPCEAGLIKSEFLGAVDDMKPPGRRSWSGCGSIARDWSSAIAGRRVRTERHRNIT